MNWFKEAGRPPRTQLASEVVYGSHDPRSRPPLEGRPQLKRQRVAPFARQSQRRHAVTVSLRKGPTAVARRSARCTGL